MSGFEQFIEDSKNATVLPVIDTLPADLLTPLGVYLKLASTGYEAFLLESVEGGENLARYSFIGSEPYISVKSTRAETLIVTEDGETKITTPLWEYLRGHFELLSVPENRDFPSFIGGAIGYFGFPCSGWFEPTLKQEISPEPDAELMFFRSVVAFDHVKQVIKIISLVFLKEVEATELRDAYDAATERNRSLKRTLEEGQMAFPSTSYVRPGSVPVSNWERPDFERAVAKIKESIAAGDCYQVVLSQCFSQKTDASAVAIYRALRSLNPSPYLFLLQFSDKAVIGASPEMLVRVRGKQLEYRPIAGTRPRGESAEEDVRLAAEMQADAKEVSEHEMLVDLGRNDLGRVARYGSVKVNGHMNVEKYSHVQHLVSYLSAELADGRDRFDAFAACFPAGTVSGAPKIAAIEIIQRLEPSRRGIYAGAVGYIDYAGNLDTCIAIRTLVLANGEAKIQAGAGIVADSVPALEFDETVNKAKALLNAVEIAEGRDL